MFITKLTVLGEGTNDDTNDKFGELKKNSVLILLKLLFKFGL